MVSGRTDRIPGAAQALGQIAQAVVGAIGQGAGMAGMNAMMAQDYKAWQQQMKMLQGMGQSNKAFVQGTLGRGMGMGLSGGLGAGGGAVNPDGNRITLNLAPV
ncbi:MAG: hypothetical protein ACYCW6_09715 [Candidatus Xenobia bacterium]